MIDIRMMSAIILQGRINYSSVTIPDVNLCASFELTAYQELAEFYTMIVCGFEQIVCGSGRLEMKQVG